MERIYKLDLKRIVSVMDIFDGNTIVQEMKCPSNSFLHNLAAAVQRCTVVAL